MGYAVYEIERAGKQAFGGYGVPAYCDHPECNKKIYRGVDCRYEGENDPHFEHGLYFCEDHIDPSEEDFLAAAVNPKPEHPEWIAHMMADPTWADWREENGHPRHPDLPYDQTAPWYRYHELQEKEREYLEQEVVWDGERLELVFGSTAKNNVLRSLETIKLLEAIEDTEGLKKYLAPRGEVIGA
ncbi:MAG: hypothetical protein AAGA46_03375 [Cyanobacteria bacterium P01_F01_bin.13]